MKRIRHVGVALLTVVAVSNAWADEVTDWNQTMLRAGLVAGTSSTNLTRVAALVQASVFDALNGIDRRYSPVCSIDSSLNNIGRNCASYLTSSAPAGASRRAAAAQAAYVILSKVYGASGLAGTGFTPPNQQATLDAKLRASLTAIGARETAQAIAGGVAWGGAVAHAIWDWRSKDNFDTNPPTYVGGTGLGQWRQTPNDPAPGTSAKGSGFPQVSNMTPWAITSPSQFRPSAPYASTVAAALASPRYARDLNETKTMGSYNSPARSGDQTIYSLLWAAGTATYLWNNVAVSLIDGRNRDRDEHGDRNEHHGDGDDEGGHNGRQSLLENARLLAALNVATADAAIGCWDAKYTYSFWRPITAIREYGAPAATPPIAVDPTWMPMFATPAHPDFPSGHSCLSGAAAVVLGDEFGGNVRFSITSDLMLGVTRSFHGFGEALEEVKNARIFSGIHFRLATEVGQALGKSVAEYVLATKFQRVN